MLTRPEPTSNGNCDSWDFIVGKNPDLPSDPKASKHPLQLSNINLSTTY